LAVDANIKHYKSQHHRPDLVQVLDVFCKVNAMAILDMLASKKSFAQLRHAALLFLDLLASSRRASLEPLAAKVSAMVCKILTEVPVLSLTSGRFQLSILNAVHSAARLQLMASAAAERLVGFIADAACCDLPPALIKSTLIYLAENPSMQPYLWPHTLNAFAASPAASGGASAAHLSHALARLSSAWVSAGTPVSWSTGLHVPSAAALLSRLFVSVMCCSASSSGATFSDLMNALLHSLNNMALFLAENARDIIRSHMSTIALPPLSGSAPTPRFPASPNTSPVTPQTPTPTMSFATFITPSPSLCRDQSGSNIHEIFVKLWGNVVAATGSSGFAQQACDALCAFVVAQKTSGRRAAEDEIVVSLRMLAATAQLFITPACCRCILDCCFEVGISSSSRRVQAAACHTFIAAAKLDHNEAAASLQRHVEAPTKGLLKNFLTMVDKAGGGKGRKKALEEQGRIVSFAMQICGRIFTESSVDASLVARTHALCGSYVMPLLERDMTRGDVTAILHAAKAIVGFVEAQGKNCDWMVNDSRDTSGAGLWNYPYSLSPLLQLVNSASAIILKISCATGGKSQEMGMKEQAVVDAESSSSSAILPTFALSLATAASAPPATAASACSSSCTTLQHAAVAIVEAARVLCSRSNSRSSAIAHSIALQFISLCSNGDVLWRTLDDSAAAQLLKVMTSFLSDVVALGGRNVELSIARAVAAAGDTALLHVPPVILMLFLCSSFVHASAVRCPGNFTVSLNPKCILATFSSVSICSGVWIVRPCRQEQYWN
jgi:hypothetical protein